MLGLSRGAGTAVPLAEARLGPGWLFSRAGAFQPPAAFPDPCWHLAHVSC